MENQKAYFYILTNKGKTVLYAGSTKNLADRIRRHQNRYERGFTYKYNVTQLIYFEILDDINLARKREKQIKGWTRKRKIELIESKNEKWVDLSHEVSGDPSLRSG